MSTRITGGNPRAAMLQGLPVGTLMISACALAGACAGLAGMIEVAAVNGSANASLVAGYGYTGILVAFLARHSPLAIMPVAFVFGGIVASGGLIQRRMGLPDATILVLQGMVFVTILVSGMVGWLVCAWGLARRGGGLVVLFAFATACSAHPSRWSCPFVPSGTLR